MSDCKRGTEAPLAFRPSADSAPVRTLVDLGPSIANPGPLGLFAFSLTTVFLSCANAGLVEIDFEAVVWCYALAWGGATQWVAGILEFFKKNIFGATVFCTYGAFWVGLAIFKFAVAGKALTLSGSIQGGMALYFSAWGVLSIVYFIGSLRVSVALAAIFVPLILAFFTLVGGQYSTASLRAGGWFGIMAAAIAFYLGERFSRHCSMKKPTHFFSRFLFTRRPRCRPISERDVPI
ncbi:hypothetical protein M427DRAFT_173170 [Gonapodya prolifera JEL478]|uniref:GPR1/FUN34/yaaH family protein n=1 Tax=Gonapodya prolifera (strain JEL478) TaxID=1344416 RepID=A0A139B0G5_GONPJ|nr:hypothetical protein M427DRAFT_173170 [Gonapodya prolifera JEL478]|eukprot:KXS22464.1 hypothetical protein M427DRAFT_173170 [Gonapodya prolifera JEL478]